MHFSKGETYSSVYSLPPIDQTVHFMANGIFKSFGQTFKLPLSAWSAKAFS
jgi:hypothetical protein